MAVRRTTYQPPTYLAFDGASNSYVDLGGTGLVPDATAAFSVAVWVYLGPLGTGSSDGIRVIAGNRRDSTTAGWVFKIANKAQQKAELTFFDQNSSSQGWISNYTVPDYRWTHIGATFDGLQVIFYVDGNAEPKETLGSPKTMKEYTGQNIRIGHRQAAGSTFETFSGKMAQLGLWNRKLSAAEFAELYRFQSVPSTGLLGYYAMNEGTGSAVNNSLATFNGTITGGVTWATTALNTARSVTGSRAVAVNRTVAGSRTIV